MQLQFPPTGSIEIRTDENGVFRFAYAPIDATFIAPLEDVLDGTLRVARDYAVKDEGGTTLAYYVTELHEGSINTYHARGYLRGVHHEPQGVVSQAEHDEKISAAIDASFEAGRQVGVEEATEAAKGKTAHSIICTINTAQLDESMVARLVDQSVAKMFAADGPITKGPSDRTWPPRFGPIGGNA